MNTRVMLNADTSANRLTFPGKWNLEHSQLKFPIGVIYLINFASFYIKASSEHVAKVDYPILCIKK